MAGKEKLIKIQCTGSDILPLNEIETFQEGLKKRTVKDLDLIKKSILKYGFSFPFYIWKRGNHNYCIDGHGRLQVLQTMQEEGVKLPDFPVVYIKAKNKEEAKNKLLRLNSQYGQITKVGILEFVKDIDLEWEDLKIYSQELIINPDYKSEDEWVGMPDFEPADKPFKLIISFDTEKDMDSFSKTKKIKVRTKGKTTWSTWYPYKETRDLKGLVYEPTKK